MLGFSPIHLGNSKKLENAPDIIVQCGSDVLVVECTIGQIKSDKASHLHARSISMRESLAAAKRPDARVLALMVTQRSLDEVQADLHLTKKQQIAVWTKEDLVTLEERSRLGGDAAELFERYWQKVLRAATDERQIGDGF